MNEIQERVQKEIELCEFQVKARQEAIDSLTKQIDLSEREVKIIIDNFEVLTPKFKYESLPEYIEVRKEALKLQVKGDIDRINSEIKMIKGDLENFNKRLEFAKDGRLEAKLIEQEEIQKANDELEKAKKELEVTKDAIEEIKKEELEKLAGGN